jgi:uncharacterized membrane protein
VAGPVAVPHDGGGHLDLADLGADYLEYRYDGDTALAAMAMRSYLPSWISILADRVSSAL